MSFFNSKNKYLYAKAFDIYFLTLYIFFFTQRHRDRIKIRWSQIIHKRLIKNVLTYLTG